MGKKAKVGKQRKDKYYQLAKEIGFRSRSAFKLIQLNRKFGFLQKSRVLIDLCAAPGGWMQVAKQNMPVSSVVIGVDLFPIKAVPGCLAVMEDITTEKCKQSLNRELKTWKADVVLHDGAPNVGMNWLHDAHQQALLTLSAAKLASQFLRNGGWFVSKIFRSKDYNALIWVLKMLFKKVHSTKPQASRAESAEIFVVCQGFLAPDKLDARFFDPRHVFEELELEPKSANSIFHPERQKKAKAEGYPEGASSMYRPVSANELIAAETPVDLLQLATEVTLEDSAIAKHPKTTLEVRACLKDIKVLGRKDLRLVMNWCAAVKATLAPPAPAKEAKPVVDEEEDEEKQISKQLADMKESERKELKRKRKAVLKERRKLQERLDLKMVVKGDDGPTLSEGDEMFALKTVGSQKVLDRLANQTPDVTATDDVDDTDKEPKKKKMAYDPTQSHLDSSGLYYRESESEGSGGEEEDASHLHSTTLEEGLGLSDSELSFEEDSGQSSGLDSDAEDGKEARERHPLLTDLDPRTKVQRRVQRAQLWFQKDAFQGLETEADEDFELDALAKELRDKGGKIMGEPSTGSPHDSADSGEESDMEDSGDDTGDETGSDFEMDPPPKISKKDSKPPKPEKAEKKGKKKASFEIVPQTVIPGVKHMKLDEEGLALGAMIATSRKRRRDLEDSGWHRFAFNDDHLPDWFVEDEKKHCQKEAPVPKEMVEELKRRTQELNSRPIKKVIEAKARKKKRAVKNLEKAKKKVEALMESSEVSEQEKARQIKTLYKKAAGKKPEVAYVVSRRFSAGKRGGRPPGTKGPYKVVDPRMKKDTAGMMRARGAKAKGKKGAKAAKGKRGAKAAKPSKKQGGKKKGPK